MVVKKKSRKFRVCVDFTDLNKACPKNPFLVPWIDPLVDVTVGHPQMRFLRLPLDTFGPLQLRKDSFLDPN